MKPTRIILVGGFLGAGKTTLLWEAAQRLIERGLSVGLITNDQAPELVDSKLLSLNALRVAEVSGSCFCCNFNGFTDKIGELRRDAATDVIIAEPVGSCADLTSTIIRPLKHYWSNELIVSPLSVLAEPSRLLSILDGNDAGLHPDAAYIYRKQLEESDAILISKSDSIDSRELKTLESHLGASFPTAAIRSVSVVTGDGIDGWLDDMLSQNSTAGRVTEMDYDRYANGEAVLGWLNGTVVLRGEDADWASFAKTFLTALSDTLDNEACAIAHLKLIVENGSEYIVGNLTGGVKTPTLRGELGRVGSVKLIINARVETTPENLDKIVREKLHELTADNYSAEVLAWRYLSPGRPNPTHHMTGGV